MHLTNAPSPGEAGALIVNFHRITISKTTFYIFHNKFDR